MSRRTAWKLCSQAGITSSAQRARRRSGKRPGPPVFDDYVQRIFTADAPNTVWVTDMTEHRTDEGRLYCCAIKDLCGNRIVGYSIGDRMTAALAVNALNNAVARRGDVAGCILHADRGSQFRSRKMAAALNRHGMVGSMGRVASAGDNAAMEIVLVAAANQRAQPAALAHPARPAAGHRRLDREEVPPPTRPRRTRRLDPDRVRSHHHPNKGTRCLTHTCHRIVHHALSPRRAFPAFGSMYVPDSTAWSIAMQ